MITLKNRKAQAIIVLALVWLGSFTTSYAQTQLSGVSTIFMSQFDLTPQQYSLIYSAGTYIGMIWGLFAGPLSDKFGPRKVILVTSILCVVGMVWRIWGQTFEAQWLCNGLAGFVATAIAVNRAKVLAGWFSPAQIALTVGVVTTVSPIASTLGMGTTALLPSLTVAFILTAVISVAFFVFWLLFGKEKADDVVVPPSEPTWKYIKDVVKNPWVWIVCIAIFFVMGAQVPVMAMTTPALVNGRGLDPAAAGAFATAITIAMGIGGIVTPLIVKKTKRYRPIVLVYGIVGALCIIFAWQMPIGPVMYGVYFVLGFILGSFIPMLYTWPIYIVGRERAGTAGGLVSVFMSAGASLMLSQVIIPIAGGKNYPGIFTGAVICFVICFVLMLIIPDQGSNLAKIEVVSANNDDTRDSA